MAEGLANRELGRIARHANGDRGAETLLKHLAACATLAGGLSRQEMLDVTDRELHALRRSYPAGPGALVDLLHEALPLRGGGVAAVLPDIVGEALVLRAFTGPDTSDDGTAVVLRVVQTTTEKVVASVVRCCQDFCPAPAQRREPLDWIAALIREGKTQNPSLLVQIDAAMPAYSLSLAELAVEVSRALLAAFTGEGIDENDESKSAIRARLLVTLATRLSDLGRREEALERAEEAESIYQQLAARQPDALLPRHATSLDNLALMLSELGRREEALERATQAERIRRQLAESRPLAVLSDHANSLNNLAIMLSALGRNDQALEHAAAAERIRRQLATDRPAAFLPDHAKSLINLALRLSALSRREEALGRAAEAERIYRQLAEARPDAFLPDHAMSLNCLAGTLSELGRHAEALGRAAEAERIYRQLAAPRPDVFTVDWARSLARVGACLRASARNTEAADQFKAAISALLATFLSLPRAHARLMDNMSRHYIACVQQAGGEPDLSLLAPITEVLQRLDDVKPER